MGAKIEQIDIKKIMEEIREEIKVKGYTVNELSFNDIAIPKGYDTDTNAIGLSEGIMEAAACQRVDLYYPLSGNAFKVFIKKIIRKLVGWVLIPVTFEQERYNAAMVKNIQQVEVYINSQQEEIEDLKMQINKLKSQIDNK